MLNDSARVRRLLARAGLLGCTLMAAIVLSSAYLRLQTIGIGCEDWPACYGRIQQAAGGDGAVARGAQSMLVTVARLLHRASAMLVAVVVAFVQLLSLTRVGRTRANLTIAIALVILTAALAVIGRASAGTLVPLIGVANLVGGFSMLALFCLLTLRNARTSAGPRVVHGAVRAFASSSLVLLAVHITVGALVSVTYSAPLCTGVLSCQRTAGNVLGSLAGLNPAAALGVDISSRVVAPAGAAELQLVHRALGLGLGGLLIALAALLVLKREQRGLGIAIALTAFAEALLGIYMVSTEFPLASALLHNLTAAALLVLLVSLVSDAGCRQIRRA